MIDAEMYGMIPSAKIVKRDSAPPENMLNMPRMPPCWLWNSFASSVRVDTRHRNVRPDPVDDQRPQQEHARRRLDRRTSPALATGIGA